LIAKLPVVELLELLGHEDADVVAIAAEALRQAPGLDNIPLDRWLALLELPQPAAIEVVCELMFKFLQANRLTLEQAVKLAKSRVLPVARLGLNFLQSKQPQSEADCRALLDLADAECELVRPELVKWARSVLSKSPHFHYSWVLEFLDSRQ